MAELKIGGATITLDVDITKMLKAILWIIGLSALGFYNQVMRIENDRKEADTEAASSQRNYQMQKILYDHAATTFRIELYLSHKDPHYWEIVSRYPKPPEMPALPGHEDPRGPFSERR
jgi:hypothetical protein